MNRNKLNAIIVLFLLFFNISAAHALIVETHEAINRQAASSTFNNFSLDLYLKNNLGISVGIDQPYNGNISVSDWISLGGKFEDKPPWNIPYLRSVNHFHNPLTDQGYSGFWGTGIFSGISAIEWALTDVATQSTGGYYSWKDVRKYYYNALTSPIKGDRDTNFANSFRGIGQLMHLIQDMSVPDHTRDDGYHALFAGYEEWVRDTQTPNSIVENNTILRDAFSNPVLFDPNSLATLSGTFPTPNSVPIANLFDMQKYSRPSPDPMVTVNGVIGLSEYTQANFFSPETIYPLLDQSGNVKFPFPALNNLVVYDELVPGTTSEYRTFLKKTGDGVAVDHLATYGWFTRYGVSSTLGVNLIDPDHEVYSDYAKLLLPRAVGYSASMLNYFFRGKLDLQGAGASGYTIVNKSSESLLPTPAGNTNLSGSSYSTICIYYDQNGGLDQNGNQILNRILITGNSSTSCVNVLTEIASGQVSSPINFTVPGDNYYPNQYWLVYNGTLGGEQNAVIGSFTGSWIEDWNNGITGTHNWWNSQIDPGTKFTVTNGTTNGYSTSSTAYVATGNPPGTDLILTNYRPVGTVVSWPSYGSQDQDLAIGVGADPLVNSNDPRYIDAFPVNITTNSVLHLKVDAMSSVPATIPYQTCTSPWSGSSPGAWQSINVTFNNGHRFFFTAPGQIPPGTSNDHGFYVNLGIDAYINPYQYFQNNGIAFTEPLQITSIDINQQLGQLCSSNTSEQSQTMQIDFIKILGQ